MAGSRKHQRPLCCLAHSARGLQSCGERSAWGLEACLARDKRLAIHLSFSDALSSSKRDHGDIGICPALHPCHKSWCWLGLHSVLNRLTTVGSSHVEGAVMCSCNHAIQAMAWLGLLSCGSEGGQVCCRGHSGAAAVKCIRQCLRPPQQAAAAAGALSHGRWAPSAVFPLPIRAHPLGCGHILLEAARPSCIAI